MKSLISKLSAILLLMFNVYIVNAQQPLTIQSVTGEDSYMPVNVENTWHVVSGKQVTVTLSASRPNDTEEKKYSETIIYQKNGTTIESNNDQFTPSEDVSVEYTAVFEYQQYVKDPETGNWIPDGDKQTETDTQTITFKIYNVELTNFKIIKEIRYTYTEALPVEMSVSHDKIDLTPNYMWYVDDKKTSITSKQYSYPTEKCVIDSKVKCVATVLAPDGKTQWGSPVTTEEVLLTVYNTPSVTSVVPEKNYTYDTARPFNVTANVSKDDGIEISVKWEGASGSDSDLTATFNPNKADAHTVKAIVTFKDPDGNELLKGDADCTIVVYKTPSVKSVVPKKSYTYDKDQPFEVKVDVDKDEDITTSVAWEGASGSGLITTFNPQEKGAGRHKVKAIVKFYDPDQNLLLTSKEVSCDIRVYNTPITALNSDRKFAMDGDNPFDVTLQIDNNPDKLSYDVKWSENVTLYHDNKEKASFNPRDYKSNTYEVIASVNFKDENNNELFISSNTLKIKVFGEAKVVENDCHKNEQDQDNNNKEYSIYANDGFNLSDLLDLKGGNDEGWIFHYSIDGGDKLEVGSPIKLSPKEQAYKIKLFVKNIDPDKNELLSETTRTYSLSVFENPKWEILNDSTVFDKGDTVLHVRSNDEVVITATLTVGNPELWKTYCGESSLKHTKDGKTRDYTFQEETQKEYPLAFDFQYEIPNLYKRSENKSEKIKRTIVVWNKIEASLTADQELDQFQAEDNVAISLNLTGGDPAKWSVSCDGIDNARWNPQSQTFDIQKIQLKKNEDGSDENESKYDLELKAKYKDGQTKTDMLTIPVSLVVYGRPALSSYTFQIPAKGLVYEPVVKGYGSEQITCYENDEVKLCLNLIGGNPKGIWKYRIDSDKHYNDVPAEDNQIVMTDSGNRQIGLYFKRSENNSESRVEQINLNLSRVTIPEIKNVLPNVDKTTSEMWEQSSQEIIDLYDGHTASFDFSHLEENAGKFDGWTYEWQVDEKAPVSESSGKWDFKAENQSTEPAIHTINVKIKNAIPGRNEKEVENVGYAIGYNGIPAKQFKVRVHPKVRFPENFTFRDKNNENNDMMETHSTRVGNEIIANVDAATGGYAPKGFEYKWSGTSKAVASSERSWNEVSTISNKSDGMHSESHRYGLTIEHKGPRNTQWDIKEYAPLDITVYNKPIAPKSIVQKGNGNSGTMIITSDVSDSDLQGNDYYLVFGYTDASGDHPFAAQKQSNPGQVRWNSSYKTDEQMSNAFVYAVWIDRTKNVMITSARRSLSGIDEDWDNSDYTYDAGSSMTRAIIEGNTDGINDVEAIDFSHCDDVCIYNMNGVLVGSNVSNLTPGIYVIRYQQGNEMKSRKLSVKY